MQANCEKNSALFPSYLQREVLCFEMVADPVCKNLKTN